jgi:HSP20 family molecular chaperone IbpA
MMFVLSSTSPLASSCGATYGNKYGCPRGASRHHEPGMILPNLLLARLLLAKMAESEQQEQQEQQTEHNDDNNKSQESSSSSNKESTTESKDKDVATPTTMGETQQRTSAATSTLTPKTANHTKKNYHHRRIFHQSPVMHVEEDESKATLSLDVPGFQSHDLNIVYEKDLLTVSGKRTNRLGDTHVFRKRIPVDSALLVSSAEPSAMSADLTQGVLSITLLKKQEEKEPASRWIRITTATTTPSSTNENKPNVATADKAVDEIHLASPIQDDETVESPVAVESTTTKTTAEAEQPSPAASVVETVEDEDDETNSMPAVAVETNQVEPNAETTTEESSSSLVLEKETSEWEHVTESL